MATTDHNSVGAGATPKLGRAKPFGLAKPGGHINSVPKASDFSSVGKPARPGRSQSSAGVTKGSPPKVARPGGPQSASK